MSNTVNTWLCVVFPAHEHNRPEHLSRERLTHTLVERVLKLLYVAGQVTVNNAESYIACALAGLGLIQVPAFDVHDHLAKGELIAVLKNWQAPAMPIQLVYPHRHPSRRLQAFNNWLAAQVMPLTASGEQ